MANIIVGKVSSDKPNKTIVVSVVRSKTHPILKKQYKVTTKFMAHDELNEAKEGDIVEIAESRPLSTKKRFVLNRIIERAKIKHVEPEAPKVAPATEEAK
jgi:small subunit ribosomal protein S17